MMRMVHLVLLFSAILGLFGQGAAFAVGPSVASYSSTIATAKMSPDCAEMMTGAVPNKAPCEGMTLDCIALMGCTIPILAQDDARLADLVKPAVVLVISMSLPKLIGRKIAPEIHPPSYLG